MDQTAITYPYTTLTDMTGATVKSILEDVADNGFNADAWPQQGGDRARVGGLQYTIDPKATMGGRISDRCLARKPPTMTLAQFGAYVRADLDRWTRLARERKISLDE